MTRRRPLLVLLACLASVVILGCGKEPAAHLGKTLDEWTAQLDSADRLDRLAAIRALADMARLQPEGSAALPELIQAMDHQDRAVRYWAVRAFEGLEEHTAAAAGRLAEALDDPAPEVRIWAAYALCREGRQSEGMPVLIAELKNPNGPARLHAAHALEALGEDARPAATALKSILDDEFGYPARVAERMLKNLGELPAE